MNISKVIIPAAGLGTRFLPYTKTIPKEMVPLGNKPAIQVIIEEGIQSGINEFDIIISKEKQDIVNYFSKDRNLEFILEKKGISHLLQSVNDIGSKTQLSFIEQLQPLGLGHAILMAHSVLQNNYFGIMLPDDIILGSHPALHQLIQISTKYNVSVIAVQEVPHERVSSYGIVDIKQKLTDHLFEVASLVEKPSLDKAPSNLAIIGRYILSSKIFESLNILNQQPRKGELQLTDGIAHMMHTKQEKVYALKVEGTRHDIGNPEGWFKAIQDIIKQAS